jgi:hypothetical protein
LSCIHLLVNFKHHHDSILHLQHGFVLMKLSHYLTPVGLALSGCQPTLHDDRGDEHVIAMDSGDSAVFIDNDMDGYSADEDCDDADPFRWEGTGTVEGVRLNESEDYASFCMGRCEVDVEGSLWIENASDADLEALSCVRSVSSYLQIRETALTSLQGLSNLEYVYEVTISSNKQLRSLDGLSTDTEDLYISANPSLESISALSGLRGLNGDLSITDNPLLQSLEGLESVNTISGRLGVYRNDSLTNLEGLSGLVNVLGGASFSDNELLADVSALENLRFVGGWLSFEQLPSLVSIQDIACALEGNTYPGLYVENTFSINYNSALEELPFCANFVTSGEGMKITGNPSLHSISGLSSEYLRYSLDLSDNAALQSLDDLSSLRVAYGDLMISGSYDADLDISALEGLEHVGGSLLLAHMVAPDLSFLADLEHIEERLSIYNVLGLTDLSGLESLEEIGGTLSLSWMNEMTSLRGASKLREIGSLAMDDLTNLQHLELPFEVHSGVTLSDMPVLETINIESVVSDELAIYVYDTPVLHNISIPDNIDSIKTFFVDQAPALASLDMLSNISTISWRLYLEETGVEHLNGLSSLQSLARLTLEDNSSLHDISALVGRIDQLDAVEIIDNPCLIQSDVDAFLDGVQVEGNRITDNNSGPC